MSYQVLARKWRPRLFSAMVGQGHVLKVLVNALDSGRLHHAYLFTGTRGVGKTTLARILAKCLNCEAGVSSEPCGQCDACTGIDEGRFVDLIEVDAASRAKVDETRELMDNVQYAPTVGRYKVYLIDEVHMFSKHSFNALLKTLEEPPAHVKFLLATTEPKRIPVTILSRCLQFNLKHLGVELIEAQLKKILDEEDIPAEDSCARLVAHAADGSMRDALSLLDQAVSYGDGRLEAAQVRDMLGTIDGEELGVLLTHVIDQDAAAMLARVRSMTELSTDYDGMLSGLLSILHDTAVAQVLPDGSDLVPETCHDFARRLDKETVQLYYQLALNGRRDLQMAPDQKTAFEMTLIRMLAFQPWEASGAAESDNGRVAGHTGPGTAAAAGQVRSRREAGPGTAAAAGQVRSRREAGPGTATATGQARDRHEAGPGTTAAAGQVRSRREAGPGTAAVAGQVRGRREAGPGTAAVAGQVRGRREAGPGTAAPAARGGSETRPALGGNDDWHGLVASMALDGLTREFASHCTLLEHRGSRICLNLHPSQEHFTATSQKDKLQAALRAYFGPETRLVVSVEKTGNETLAQKKIRTEREAKQAALEAVENDPGVKLLVDTFDATIDRESIKATSKN